MQILQKFNKNDINDCVLFWYTLSRNLDASVTLQSKFNCQLHQKLNYNDIRSIILSNKEYFKHYQNELKDNQTTIKYTLK